MRALGFLATGFSGLGAVTRFRTTLGGGGVGGGVATSFLLTTSVLITFFVDSTSGSCFIGAITATFLATSVLSFLLGSFLK